MAGLTFVYPDAASMPSSFLYACASCSPNCDGPQPALFELKANNTTLKNFHYQYFPKGSASRAERETSSRT
jgi:hypothetical protein